LQIAWRRAVPTLPLASSSVDAPSPCAHQQGDDKTLATMGHCVAGLLESHGDLYSGTSIVSCSGEHEKTTSLIKRLLLNPSPIVADAGKEALGALSDAHSPSAFLLVQEIGGVHNRGNLEEELKAYLQAAEAAGVNITDGRSTAAVIKEGLKNHAVPGASRAKITIFSTLTRMQGQLDELLKGGAGRSMGHPPPPAASGVLAPPPLVPTSLPPLVPPPPPPPPPSVAPLAAREQPTARERPRMAPPPTGPAHVAGITDAIAAFAEGRFKLKPVPTSEAAVKRAEYRTEAAQLSAQLDRMLAGRRGAIDGDQDVEESVAAADDGDGDAADDGGGDAARVRADNEAAGEADDQAAGDADAEAASGPDGQAAGDADDQAAHDADDQAAGDANDQAAASDADDQAAGNANDQAAASDADEQAAGNADDQAASDAGAVDNAAAEDKIAVMLS
jgi:hypothetical protein